MTERTSLREARRGRVERGALYVAELSLVLVLGFSALAVGTFASWWGALGMVATFILGGVFRDFYNMRIGRL